jgi:hypothetical protein
MLSGSSRQERRQVDLSADWRVGPRTSAWDALWRRILADVLSEGHHAGGPHEPADVVAFATENVPPKSSGPDKADSDPER